MPEINKVEAILQGVTFTRAEHGERDVSVLESSFYETGVEFNEELGFLMVNKDLWKDDQLHSHLLGFGLPAYTRGLPAYKQHRPPKPALLGMVEWGSATAGDTIEGVSTISEQGGPEGYYLYNTPQAVEGADQLVIAYSFTIDIGRKIVSRSVEGMVGRGKRQALRAIYAGKTVVGKLPGVESIAQASKFSEEVDLVAERVLDVQLIPPRYIITRGPLLREGVYRPGTSTSRGSAR